MKPGRNTRAWHCQGWHRPNPLGWAVRFSLPVLTTCLALVGLLPAQVFQSGLPEPSRVVMVEHPEATDAFQPQLEVVRRMVREGLTRLTGEPDVTQAWLSLLHTNDVVGLKVHSAPGRVGGTRPATVAAVVESLLTAGLPPEHVVLWDKRLADLGQAGFFELGDRYGVRVASSTTVGWDEAQFYEVALPGSLVWGDLEFGRKEDSVGRKSHVTKLVTQELSVLINLSPMLNHNQARVAGNLYSLAMGSVDNSLRFEQSALRLEVSVPEIYALPVLGDRVVLNLVDALIAQYEGEQRPLLHYSYPLNQLRFSRDPVALDVLSVHELMRLRPTPPPDNVRTNFTLFENAALLQIGNADTNRIVVERVVLTGAAPPAAPPPQGQTSR